MQQRTMMFAGLMVAMILVLAYAWYEWSQPLLPAQTVAQLPPSTAATSSAQQTATNSSAAVPATVHASLYPPPALGEQQGIVRFGGQTLYVDLAQNPAQQELGLGNRASLGVDQGMLFIFPNDAQHLFWMKDMSFSIDMIWLSDDGTVIYIQPNVAPSTYPDAFGPSGNSRYVLEVPANFAADHGVVVGTKAVLP